MITEDYISFETAKLLKEKGFDEPLMSFYTSDKKPYIGAVLMKCNLDVPDVYPRPTLQMAMKWLREAHNIQLVVSPYNIPNKTWSYYIFKNFDALTQYFYFFNTYEEACKAAIKYCLENLI